MFLKELKITDFKNIPDASLEFSPNINGFLGSNGMGKSNLLDAIYFLSFCRSFSGLRDAELIRRGQQLTMLQAVYMRGGSADELTFGMQQGRRKSFKRRGKAYGRLSEHIGAFPAVLVSPRDMEMVTGASDDRRRFVDMIVSQSDPVYLQRLIRYGTALQQRNALLRDGAADRSLFEAVEADMAMTAAYITARRGEFCQRFNEIFLPLYARIARTDECPAVAYRSSEAAEGLPLADIFERNRSRDAILGHTTAGPHRDDLLLSLDGMPLKTTASQGQAKTFTIAMRLAQYRFLAEATGLKPLLLLDDIFDKLDASRVANIVELASGDSFGQIFITDTNRDHLDSIMAASASDYRLWLVSDGTFTLAHQDDETH